MSGMQRFISYLYLYENEEKAGNVGFAKIELRGEDCRIEVHMRGTFTNNLSCKIYLFTNEQDFIQGIYIGNMKILNGAGNFWKKIPAKRIGAPEKSFAEIDGLLVHCEDDRIFATKWKEGAEVPIGLRTFRAAAENDEPVRQENAEAVRQEQGDAIHVAEVPMRNIFPELEWKEKWETLLAEYPIVHPFQETDVTCIRIELKDLRELPKRYWYLGNNSFLLHGFFNYHYLVVGNKNEDGVGKWFLGVPGVYQPQERVMAAIFGFPEFIPEAGHHEEGKEPFNQFGCWCRQMDE